MWRDYFEFVFQERSDAGGCYVFDASSRFVGPLRWLYICHAQTHPRRLTMRMRVACAEFVLLSRVVRASYDRTAIRVSQQAFAVRVCMLVSQDGRSGFHFIPRIVLYIQTICD